MIRFIILSIFIFYHTFAHTTVYLNQPDDFHPKMEVIGCFLEYQDKILLLHRQENKSQGNLWAIPGGKMDKNETPIEAIIREVAEETNFDLSKQQLTYLGKVYIKYPYIDYIYHMVRCKPSEAPGSVKINFEEHKGFTWVTPCDALKMNLMLDEDTCIKMIYDMK